MRLIWRRVAALAATIFLGMGLLSCGHDRKLVSITVTPDNVTFGGPGIVVQYKAIGNYIHPPQTRDITDQVVWQSAAPQVIGFDFVGSTVGQAESDPTGLVFCGTNIDITATVFSNPSNPAAGTAIVGRALANVTCPK